MEENIFNQSSPVTALNVRLAEIRNEISKVIVGQYQVVDLLITGLLCDGHILLEGVPGVAKTLVAKLMAKIIDINFSRIQFTPDLMPGDVIGTSVFNPKEGSFYFPANFYCRRWIVAYKIPGSNRDNGVNFSAVYLRAAAQ